jgi:general secretion pathway protein L
MAETLYIRLGSQQQDKVHWLIATNADHSIIASGELNNAGQLSALTEKAKHRQIKVFVPGADVLLKPLKVPGKSQRGIRLAVPYMLEDSLAQDVEQLFFAYANIKTDEQGNNCFVAVVEKAQMLLWQAWLNEAQINPEIMLPETLAMPLVKDAYTGIALGEQIILRQSEWQGMTLDLPAWTLICQRGLQDSVEASSPSAAEDKEQTKPILEIKTYSPLGETFDAPNPAVNMTAMPEVLPMVLLAEHGTIQKFNLLQGEFQIKQPRSPALVNWAWAAGLLLFALFMNMGINGAKIISVNAQQAEIEQQIISRYKSVFPGSKRVRINLIKSQLTSKLSALGSASQGEGFLTILSKVQPAFATVPELKPDNLAFDAKRQELRLKAIAKDYQHFDRFKAALEKSSLSVSQGAQSNQDNQVSGTFSIKGRS